MTAPPGTPGRFEVWGVGGIPEVRPGDDLAGLLEQALRATETDTSADSPAKTATPPLADGDIVVVTSKIVSKAEGRIQLGVDREQAIDDEAVRTVSAWTTPHGRTRIVETRHGFVMAAAGVDASNVEAGHVVLLPEDPDASARQLRESLRTRFGVRVGVVLTDTAGRAWRNGVVDMAVGASGVVTIDDLRGRTDGYGNDLGVTMVAVADELAAATELVRSKLAGVPVAVVRGLAHLVLPEPPGTSESDSDGPGATALVRPSAEDRFRLGTPEAMRAAVTARRDVRDFRPVPLEPDLVRRAVAAALTAAHPHTERTGPAAEPVLRIVLVESVTAREKLLAGLPAAHDDAASTLSTAPCLLAPFLTGPTPGTADLLAGGAAVENLLVAFGAEGVGATWFAADDAGASAQAALALPDTWYPLGLVAAGYPATPPAAHANQPIEGFLLSR